MVAALPRATQPTSVPVATQPALASPAGVWRWTSGFGNREYTLRLKLEGDRPSGTLSRDGMEVPIRDARFADGKLSFTVTMLRNGQRYTSKYAGELNGDALKGQYTIDFGGQARTREWDAKRVKE